MIGAQRFCRGNNLLAFYRRLRRGEACLWHKFKVQSSKFARYRIGVYLVLLFLKKGVYFVLCTSYFVPRFLLRTSNLVPKMLPATLCCSETSQIIALRFISVFVEMRHVSPIVTPRNRYKSKRFIEKRRVKSCANPLFRFSS